MKFTSEFPHPKIAYPEIAKEPRFVLDTQGMFVNNKVFVIPSADLFLLAVLNSAVVWEYLRGCLRIVVLNMLML
jgi:hypothetical protein